MRKDPWFSIMVACVVIIIICVFALNYVRRLNSQSSHLHPDLYSGVVTVNPDILAQIG